MMTAVGPVKDIGRVIEVCNPHVAIDREELEPYYVDCSPVRGGASIEQLERFLVGSQRPTHQLLSGHRGCGKTSEIYQLRKRLEGGDAGRRYRTIYLDADAELDTNDVTLVDLVLVIIKRIREETEQITFSWTQWKHLWSELLQVLERSDIESKQELNLGIVKWSWAIKSNPEARAGIRKAYEPWVSRLLELANDYLVEVRRATQQQGYGDVVLIIDSLDRIVLKEQDRETGKTNHDALFVDRASQIKALDVHMLITLPISMCYTSINAPQLGTLYDNEPVIIPMIKTWDRKSGKDDRGLDILGEILGRRLDLDRIFDERETWLTACRESGGSVRDLFRIVIQAALQRKGERLTRQDIEAGLASIVNTYDRLTWGPFLPIFVHVSKEHQFPDDVDVTLKRQALYNLFVLEYQDQNGTPWFDLHPFVRRARAVKQSLAPGGGDGC
ncbi:MAG: hypothetical protein HYY85_05000 [Deltaproteobacteria bacterium]|nr:hypothetical protein [Deltaproteobacteria bacterium]